MHFQPRYLSLSSLVLTTVRAAPLAIDRRGMFQLNVRNDPRLNCSSTAISQDLLNTLSFFEQYSAAAYCPGDNIAAPDTAITCDAGNCPQVQSAGAESLLEFEKYVLTV